MVTYCGLMPAIPRCGVGGLEWRPGIGAVMVGATVMLEILPCLDCPVQ
jgi:hypothetical protein